MNGKDIDHFENGKLPITILFIFGLSANIQIKIADNIISLRRSDAQTKKSFSFR